MVNFSRSVASRNIVPDQGAFYIAEGLKKSTVLSKLDLPCCGLTSKGVEYLSDALATNNSLNELTLHDNPLCDNGIQHLANALKDNHNLKNLGLENCSMTDVGLEHLANSLQANRSLNQLHLYNIGSGVENHITGKSVLFLIKNNSTLEELSLPADFKSSTNSIQEIINETRKRSGLSFIKVTGKSCMCTCA